MQIIDTRGKTCPLPLIMLKKTLSTTEPLTHFIILTDNDISKNNLLSFLHDNQYLSSVQECDSYWEIIVTNAQDTSPNSDPFYRQKKKELRINIIDAIIVVDSDSMGRGNEDLGKMLICAFFSQLVEQDTLPEKIIFYNHGALLTKQDSPIITYLEKLTAQQIEIIICGACVEFLGLKDKIKIGTISNMLTISGYLTKTNKIIYL